MNLETDNIDQPEFQPTLEINKKNGKDSIILRVFMWVCRAISVYMCYVLFAMGDASIPQWAFAAFCMYWTFDGYKREAFKEKKRGGYKKRR